MVAFDITFKQYSRDILIHNRFVGFSISLFSKSNTSPR